MISEYYNIEIHFEREELGFLKFVNNIFRMKYNLVFSQKLQDLTGQTPDIIVGQNDSGTLSYSYPFTEPPKFYYRIEDAGSGRV